jgi:hypothetical protein
MKKGSKNLTLISPHSQDIIPRIKIKRKKNISIQVN